MISDLANPTKYSSQGLWPDYDILTNLSCNLACTYCFEHDKCGRVNDIGACRDFLRARYREDYAEKGKPVTIPAAICLIGGESFMVPDLIDGICEECARLDQEYGVVPFHIAVSTNGTLITRPENQRLLEIWSRHFYIGFSIDGTRANHDACRIDHHGRGSYDRAVDGYLWCKERFCPCRLSAKATYTHATMPTYAEGVNSLIDLGFRDLAANGVFEEDWPDSDAEMILDQLDAVTNHIFERGLQRDISFFQICHRGLDMERYEPACPRTQNHCGSCQYIRQLGFDRKIYGCHRFATMPDPMPIGHLDGDRIVITNHALVDKVVNLYKAWPDECKSCGIGGVCPSCPVTAFEFNREHPEEFFKARRQCGWAIAITAARLYFKQKLLAERGNRQ